MYSEVDIAPLSSDIVSEQLCRSRLFNDVLVDKIKASQSVLSPLLPMALLTKSNTDIELVFLITSAMYVVCPFFMKSLLDR